MIGVAFSTGSRRSCGYHFPSRVVATAIRVTFGPMMLSATSTHAEDGNHGLLHSLARRSTGATGFSVEPCCIIATLSPGGETTTKNCWCRKWVVLDRAGPTTSPVGI